LFTPSPVLVSGVCARIEETHGSVPLLLLRADESSEFVDVLGAPADRGLEKGVLDVLVPADGEPAVRFACCIGFPQRVERLQPVARHASSACDLVVEAG